MNKALSVSLFGLSAGLFFSIAAPLAFADTSCSGSVGSPLLADVTQQITNDPDSGNTGGNWAFDTFTRHIQVWSSTSTPGTYCGQTTDTGTFTTSGSGLTNVSPESGVPLLGTVTGTFSGGATYVITGTASTTSTLSDTSWTPGQAYSDWVGQYFTPDTHTILAWSWTYVSSAGESWTNTAPRDVGDIHSVVNSRTNQGYATIQAAIDDATSGDTIALASDVAVTSEIIVNKDITIDGKGHTLRASFTKNGNSDNSAIGIEHNDVTIKNLIVDGTGGQAYPNQLHGVNAYLSTGVSLDTVTVSNFTGSGVVVNGSNVTATNLTTSGNAWNGVNVDPGSGVISPSVLTLNSGTLGENTQIWSDGTYVTGTSTVTVNASGYTMYEVGNTSQYFWTNKSLTSGATITSGSIPAYYADLQSAINAASTTMVDTIVLGADATTTTQVNINKAVIIDGSSHTLRPSFTKTDNSNNSAIGVTHSNVTIRNLIEDGSSGHALHGINVYESTGVNLNDVTVSHNEHSGVNVDGSVVTVNNISTANDGWDGIDVDQGSGITATSTFPAILTVNGISSHSETSPAIQKDDNSKTFVSVVDTNNQYGSTTYVHNTNVVGTIYGMKSVTVSNESQLRAALNNTIVSTITFGSNIAIAAELDITRSVTIDGAGYILTATFNNASVIQISANNVTIKNLVEDAVGTTGNRGINIYKAVGTLLDTVTASDNTKNGIVVNGSTVTVNNVVTSNNGWGGIDVDMGSGVTSLASLTVNGTSVHNESNAAIRIDDISKIPTPMVFDTNSQYRTSLVTASTTDYYLQTKNVKIATAEHVTSTTGTTTMDISSGTIIKGDSSWDGIVTAPVATTTSLTIPGYNTTVALAISVGSDESDLTFDKAVKLTFAGQAGKSIGWYNHSGTFSEITATCTANDQTTANSLASGTSCKMDVGSDLVVWTKHFSTFVAYSSSIATPVITPNGATFRGSVTVTLDAATGTTIHYTTDGSVPDCNSNVYSSALTFSNVTTLNAIRCDAVHSSAIATASFNPVSGGGSSGGSSGGSVATTPVSSSTATPAASPVAPSVPAGEVLGASVYNFTKSLSVGSHGADVTALQQFLTDGKFYTGPVTGTFGPLTKKAVMAFQKARGIAQTGFVGPLTRAELNKGVVAVVPEAVKTSSVGSKLTTAQATSILTLLQSFGAEASVIQSVKAALGQ